MDDKKFDSEIKESIIRNTGQSLNNKEEIWESIESELNRGGYMKIKKRTGARKIKGWITGTVAAAFLLGILSMTTNTGQALINNAKEFFAPQKQVVDEIEGMPEENEVTLNEGKSGYIIYIDEERYKLVEEANMDKIIPKEPLGDRYPEVSMTISQVEDKNPEQLAQEIQQELKSSYETVKDITTVSDPMNGLLVSAIDGNEWDSQVTQVYIISNDKTGSFVIQEKYFLEAAEGHGARFHHMLKEFRIVDHTKE